jgi:hypothetical protein
MRRILIVAALCAGCTQEQVMVRATAHVVGCDADDVVLGNVEREGTRPRRWTAICRSFVWVCRSERGSISCRNSTLVTP